MFWNLAMQNDLASFCNEWMQNIKDQQYGGRLPEKPKAAPQPNRSTPSNTDSVSQGDKPHDG